MINWADRLCLSATEHCVTYQWILFNCKLTQSAIQLAA
jgi:hypothetical protein